MKRLKEKLNKNSGFTLVEMLIVVAIIAILIIISFPLISSNLEKARVAVDEANERTAMSMAETYYLLNSKDMGFSATTTAVDLYYEVDPKSHQGEIKEKDDVTAANFKYGLSKDERTVVGTEKASPEGNGVIVTVDSDGTITGVKWGSITT